MTDYYRLEVRALLWLAFGELFFIHIEMANTHGAFLWAAGIGTSLVGLGYCARASLDLIDEVGIPGPDTESTSGGGE